MRPRHLAFSTILALIASSLLGAPNGRYKKGRGVLLEAVPYDWCHADCAPFNTESLLICVQIDGKTLVGERKMGREWRLYYPQLLQGRGKPIRVQFDDHSLAVFATDGNKIQFKQRYDNDQFHIPACTAEIHRHMLNRLGKVQRPASVPVGAALIPEGGRFFWHFYFWVRCSFDPSEDDDICTYWDKAGHKTDEDHVVSEKDKKPLPDAELQIDPYTTTRNEVRLRTGIALVSDGRARINGKVVSGAPEPKGH